MITDEERQQIHDVNQVDNLLYRQAQAVFWQRVADTALASSDFFNYVEFSGYGEMVELYGSPQEEVEEEDDDDDDGEEYDEDEDDFDEEL